MEKTVVNLERWNFGAKFGIFLGEMPRVAYLAPPAVFAAAAAAFPANCLRHGIWEAFALTEITSVAHFTDLLLVSGAFVQSS